MADRIKNYQQEADQITTLKEIRTDLGVTPSSYTPDATVVTKDRVVTFAQAEEELSVLSDIEKGVKQQITEVDIAQKDITNIKALLQGHLYDYQTDNTSAYTKSVPSGAMPYAGLEKLGGKTVVWNQLVDSGTTTVSTISGHKYYTLIDGTASIVTSDGSAISIVDDTADMVCDLTLMFGSGNEPSTTADFTAIFGATHYPYNAGTLLSAGVTEVESVGKNLLNPTPDNLIAMQQVGNTFKNTATDTKTAPTLIAQYYNGTTFVANIFNSFNVSTTGVQTVTFTTPTETFNKIRIGHNGSAQDEKVTFSINLKPNTQYTLSVNITGVQPNVVGGFYFTDIQIEKGTTATSYSPYMSNSYPIPASIQALEGYGWSAGTAYNYIDYERKVFVKCVDKVVLNGTQTISIVNWRASADAVGWVYNYNVTNNKVKTVDGNVPNIISDKMETKSYQSVFEHSIGISTISSSSGVTSYGICIMQSDTTLTTDMAINAYLADHPITVYYELATPVETDISAYLTDDNLIQVESGGTLTFPNQNGTDYQIPVPSEETYMIDLQSAL